MSWRPRSTPQRPAKEPERPVWPKEAVPAWTHLDSRAYLLDRGMTEAEVARWDLQYCATGYWANRVVIPMRNAAGELTTLQGRHIDPNYKWEAKYLTRGPRGLYQPWDPPAQHGDRILVVEGAFDFFRAVRVEWTVATLGFMPSQRQTGELLALCRTHNFEHVIMWYDAEPAAIGEAHAFALKLRPHVHVTVIEQDEGQGKDPGDLHEEDIQAILDAQVG